MLEVKLLRGKFAKASLIRNHKYKLVKKRKKKEKKTSDPYSLVALPKVALFAKR